MSHVPTTLCLQLLTMWQQPPGQSTRRTARPCWLGIPTAARSSPRPATIVAAFTPDVGKTLAGMAEPFGATPLLGEFRPIEDGYLLLTLKGVKWARRG
jgi:hypothetical protein